MNDFLTGHDVYVRKVQANGHSSVEHHRCWNPDLFIQNLVDATAAANQSTPADKNEAEARVIRVEAASAEEYAAERKRG